MGDPQREQIWMESQVHWSPGCTEGNVLGPQPEVFTPSVERTFTASHSGIPKRNVLQLFKQGLQMLHSARERVFMSIFLCAHLFVFVAPCIFDSHPSLFPFAIRGSGIKPHCFYSISCHYQQQYDYWFHFVGGEQWRQQAVFSFTLPPILSSLLKRIKWGLSVRSAAKPMHRLILLEVLMFTNTRGHRAKRVRQKGTGYSWGINNLGKLQEKTNSELQYIDCTMHYYNEHHSIMPNPQGPKSTIRRSAPLNGTGKNQLQYKWSI